MPQDTTTDESGTSTKGIKAGGGMYLNGGTYQIDSADDSIHSNANITIADGTYTLATGDDGVHADDALIVNGGTITVTESYEGLEGLAVTINDGTIDITASDDGINTAGEKMELNGGYIHILAGGDGLDIFTAADTTTHGILVGLNNCTVNLSKGLCVPQDQWQQLVSLGLPGNYFDGDTMPKD